MNFSDLNDGIRRAIDNFDSLVMESLMEAETTIVDLQVAQLEKGITEKGASIEPEYFSDTYATAKKAIGAKPPKGTPDLKLSGDFYEGVYAKYYDNAKIIETFSSDRKANALTEKYKDIWGLTKENQRELNKEVKPIFLKRLRDEIFRG